jgi:hypothetical protein
VIVIPSATNGYAVETGIFESTNSQNKALNPKQVRPAKTHGELAIEIAILRGLSASARAS